VLKNLINLNRQELKIKERDNKLRKEFNVKLFKEEDLEDKERVLQKIFIIFVDIVIGNMNYPLHCVLNVIVIP
jgi:hypothetical protein